MPPLIACHVSAVAIASLYCFWQQRERRRLLHERVLRGRVAFMLWTAANRA